MSLAVCVSFSSVFSAPLIDLLNLGYYPPDHSIVTGGPNVLDSFEALLYVVDHTYICCESNDMFLRELADLLGQVKPPTATKDDLEKSGLEIIKASEVPQHEKEGKISSNCTDRVCTYALSVFFVTQVISSA